MSFSQPSDYGNIENRRAEQNKILKWKNRALVATSFVFALFFVHFSFSNSREFLSISQFFVNLNNFNENDIFYTKRYFYVSITLILILVVLFLFPSKKGMIRRFEVLTKRKKKPSLLLKIEFKIILFLDKLILYLFYPISYFVFNTGEYSKQVADKFYFRVGWFNHIENSFFKEVPIKVDGYNRVKELNILSKYKELFSSKKNDNIYSCHIYQTIYKYF